MQEKTFERARANQCTGLQMDSQPKRLRKKKKRFLVGLLDNRLLLLVVFLMF